MLNQVTSMFIAIYFIAYFAVAWLQPTVPASFRNSIWWQDWHNLLVGHYKFRLVLAIAMAFAYVLWII